MPETQLDKKIRRLRKEAMFSVLILILSLFLVFTWIGSISIVAPNAAAPSFASDAYNAFGKAMAVPEAETSAFVASISIVITVIFFSVLVAALNYQKKAPK
jgi:uncharacterized membrane protein SpoIIM required for sporulation